MNNKKWQLFALLLPLMLIFLTFFRQTIAIATNCTDDYEEHMDTNVAPCDDFYEYACGNWRAPYRLRMLGARDMLTLIRANNKKLLLQHLESSSSSSSDSDSTTTTTETTRLQKFYNSCLWMQLHGATRDSIRTYTNLLQRFSQTWPILDANYATQTQTQTQTKNQNANFNWEYVSAQLRRYGAQTLWRLLVQTNWQASEQRIFYIMPPTFDLLKTATGAGNGDAFLYKRYIKYLLFDLGVRVRQAKEIADEVVAFEQQLLALTIATDNSEHTLVLREPQTLNALARELPDTNLHLYFETLLQADVDANVDADANMDADASQKIRINKMQLAKILIVADVAYIKKLVNLLENTKTETIAKYLLIQFLAHFELHLNENRTYNDQSEHCLQQLNDFMPRELNALYLQLLYADNDDNENDNAERLQQMQKQLNIYFQQLQQQFEIALNATQIFQNAAETHVLSLQKLRAMRLILPITEDISSSSKSKSNIKTTMSDNYDENLLQLSYERTMAEFQSVLEQKSSTTTSDTTSTATTSSTSATTSTVTTGATSATTSTATTSSTSTAYGPLNVNAYYHLKKNAIELPIGLLRSPLWLNSQCSLEQPQRIYGSFVYILAHELLHGFDYDGFNYDHSGNIAENWSAKSIIHYGLRSNCYLTERYSNAALNIDENIADSEGLRLAFETLKNLETTTTNNNNNINDLKTFFIAFAQTWCGQSAATTTTTTTTTTTMSAIQHATNRERVNNVLRNFPEFAEIFQCKIDSPMHPAEKCRIW